MQSNLSFILNYAYYSRVTFIGNYLRSANSNKLLVHGPVVKTSLEYSIFFPDSVIIYLFFLSISYTASPSRISALYLRLRSLNLYKHFYANKHHAFSSYIAI